MRPHHRNLILLVLPLLILPVFRATAGTVDDLYSFNSYDGYELDPTMYKLSIPTKKISGTDTEIPVVRAIICVYPGTGGSGNASTANELYARWAYENGIAFWNVGPVYDPPADTITYLASTGTRIGRPELSNAPLIPTGESSGAYTAFDVATSYPARTLAVYGQHKGTTGSYFPPASVPANVTFGEFDASRTEYMYALALKNLEANQAAGGAPWSLMMDRGMIHTASLDYREDLMLYVETMIPLRYAYAQGVAGRDPKIGAVTLNSLGLSSGWRGEHLFSPERPDMAENGTLPYSLIVKDWDSSMLHISPGGSFDRNNPHMHSWFPNAALASAWRSRAGLGAREMRFVLRNVPGNDYADNMLLPPMLNTDQSVVAALDAGAFTTAGRVEFYDNDTLVGTDTAAPYDHSYSWGSGAAGWHVLYAIATDPATGEQRVSGSRSVRVSPKTVAANSAPTVSAFTEQTIPSGTSSVSLPFTVSDTETVAGSLTVKFFKSNSLDDGDLDGGTIAYSGALSGSGGSRSLNLTIADTAKSGVLWGYVQVHDGDLTTNSYFKVNITPTTSSAPMFVVGQTVNTLGTANGQVVFNGGWSKEIAIRVFDADTPAENLVLSATTGTPAKIPLTNIVFGGYGEFRTVKIKCDGTTGSIMTFTVSDGVNSSAPQTYNPTIATASDTPPVVDLAPVMNTLANVSLYSGESFAQIARVHDFFTASETIGAHPKLTVTATSSNQVLLPDANISIVAAGAGRRIAGTTVSGQTGSALVTVTVTDAQGLSVSDSFTVTASPAVAPIITSQPSSQPASYNGSATLSVTATGGAPASYQWYRGSSGDTAQPVSGATGSSFATPLLVASASYWVRVTNSAGTTDSATANLSVTVPPTVTAQPVSASIYSGQQAVLTVAGSGGEFACQWYEGDSGDTSTPVSGATSTSLITPALTANKKFWARLSNISGTSDSLAATISIKTRSWAAYHDTITIADGNSANVTATNVATTSGSITSLINFETGAFTGITLNALLTGSKSAKTNGDTAPSAGTDAYNAFHGIISFTGNHSEQLGGNVTTSNVRFTFSGLAPAARYSVAFYAARNAFATPNRYTISGADAFLEGHSTGVGNAGDSDPATADVASGAGSATNGYLVKWIDIAPGADGTFAVEVRTHTGTSFAIIPQAIMIEAFVSSSPLESWAASQGLTGPDADPNAMPHGDGVANLVKFALGLPGNAPAAPAALPAATLEPVTAELHFLFHRGTDDVRYVVESSSTLAAGSWVEEFTIEKNADPGTVGQDVLVEIPMGSDTKKFLRLRVAE